ncbi:RNA polymerase sigma factor [Paenibacillus glufosinatiresistens]|uniref:RNA polymerase sigma factor n=1 Tax=Paenibacillus glufosinatiresistens TaxID=3070657 RepID=UPI00286DAAE1|nr:RNA polymerase sigma factor [Paenibacillus sp. YX.27]
MPERDDLRAMVSSPDRTLRELMAEYGDDIWNYAYFLTGSRDQADEVCQETFLRAYTHLSSFRGGSTVKTWLLTIARNQALNWRRSLRLRSLPFFTGRRDAEAAPSAEREALGRQYTDAIWRIIMALPVPYREALVLDIRYDLTGEEMARLLGVAPGTVKSRLARARAKVRQALEKEESE